MGWVNESIIYHIYPLGFCGAPQKNDGVLTPRIEKLSEWIPHLKELSVNAVYLGPVFQSSEHGYDTKDYYELDSRLGDNETFAKVCDQLHENGIRVILDGVFNHVGRDFWAFKDVQQNGSNSKYCGWFHNLNFGGSSPMGDPFWYEGWQGYYNLVKLNLRNNDVVEHLLGAVGLWLEKFKIDGLRLDAADCVDQDFFRRLRAFCKGKDPEFWLMGEIIHGDYNHWANPSMLDSVTNYECHKGLYSSHNDKNYFEIGYSLNRQFGNGGIYKDLCLYNFADNHDVNRVASLLKKQEHLPLVYSLLYTMPGVPSLYYGSEWGIKGERDKTSDAALRPCLDLGKIPNPDEKLCAFLKKLGTLRRKLHALQYGSYEQCMLRNEQFVFCRVDGGDRVYAALNLSDMPQYVEFPAQPGKLTDLLTGAEFESNDGNYKLELPAFGTRIFARPEIAAGISLDQMENEPITASVEVPVQEAHFEVDTKSKEAELPIQERMPEQAVAPVAAPTVSEMVAPAAATPPIVQADAPKQAEPPKKVPAGSVPVKPGRYQDQLGKEYQVIGVGKDQLTLAEVVAYQQLFGNCQLWVTPLSYFTGTEEVGGEEQPRFFRVS